MSAGVKSRKRLVKGSGFELRNPLLLREKEVVVAGESLGLWDIGGLMGSLLPNLMGVLSTLAYGFRRLLS